MGLLQNYFFCPELFLSPIEAQALKGRQGLKARQRIDLGKGAVIPRSPGTI